MISGTSIAGVEVEDLRRIPDARGCVMHGWRNSGDPFTPLEVYATTVKQGVIKGWHLHTRLTVRYVPLVGEVRVVLVDGRLDSATFGALDEFVIGEREYARVKIPPGVWIATQGLSVGESMLLNIADQEHSREEMRRSDPHDVLVLSDGTKVGMDWCNIDG